MSYPRIGVSLPHFGPHAGPEGVVTVAKAAERLGFHAVSVTERLLMPVREDWVNDAKLPESHVFDPLELLTWAAAHTRRVRLATGVVNAIFQSPILLARRLATLDQLSHGRVDAGVGQGGGSRSAETGFAIPEEFRAAGVPMSRRGAGFVEHLAAMRACWAPDPVQFEGTHYVIPRSTVGPKPYNGTIPLLIGALLPSTIERAARIGDGFVTVAHPQNWAEIPGQVSCYRNAGGTGTVVLNTIQPFADADISAEAFTDAVLTDAAKADTAGVDEMHITLNLVGVHPDRQAELLEDLAADLKLTAAGGQEPRR
ncbi:TIGR03619 family F420-dependent LLM class oxidoreductase [Pseudonocardia sp. TRM90224]|uniref:TIGR03619 family F420-dependent LLM class oxidoreductase n=1 Tax=Pseudonocardia sp. TRM90224 TaxID=2812678 RepID=UPI001E53FF44|nr:TIGR03619 family F420-dependent LLM class oxidoreductase [Pseudonocardia sp. TRM90224]